MKRSAGVTAAAIVALSGSVFFAILSAIVLFVALVYFGSGNPASPMPRQALGAILAPMIFGALFEFGLAGWGLSTAIGLLRLKAWSRISILIFAGFLAAPAALFGLMFIFLPLPKTRAMPENFDLLFRIIPGLFWAATTSIAAWWLVFFTRKSVVAQFSVAPATATLPAETAPGNIDAPGVMAPQLRRPLTITIIAWLNVVSVPMMIPSFLLSQAQRMPVPFFGTMIEGRGVFIYYGIHSGVMLASGIALLKNRPWGYWLAVGIQSFFLVNLAAVLSLPGREARWQRFKESLLRSLPPGMAEHSSGFPTTPLAFGVGAGFLCGLVILLLLWSRRKRFLDFAAMLAVSVPGAK